jgi:hypothetical protein
MATVKASLRDRGSGRLEFADDTLRFYVERGRFKKTSDLVREIPAADVENVALVGNELSVTWKGVADVFDVESAEAAKTLCDEVNAALAQPQETAEEAVEPAVSVEEKAEEVKEELRGEVEEAEETEETPPQRQPQEAPKLFAVGKVVGAALGVADSLFDVLRCLQGRVDWSQVESSLKRSEESAEYFAEEELCTVNLDFKALSSAVKLRRAGEVGKEAFGVLKSMFEYFAGLNVTAERLQKTHPSCEDARKMVLADYTLNDLIFGVVVGDEVAEEGGALGEVLEGLSKDTGLTVDIDAVKAVVRRLAAEKAAESVVQESRLLFREQLGELLSV